MAHIAFITHRETDRRDYDRQGMAAMVAAGYSVVVINVMGLFGVKDPRKGVDDLVGTRFVRVSTRRELDRAEAEWLRTAAMVVVVTGWNGSLSELAVHRALKRAGRPCLVLSANAIPGAARYRKTNTWDRLRDAYNRWKVGHLRMLHSTLRRLPPALLGIRPFEYIVFGGEASRTLANMFLVDSTTRPILAHAMDYDSYLTERTGKPEHSNKAVFIDDCIGFNLDFAYYNLVPPVSAEEFYPRLRRLFDRVESELGLEVVVAGNPRIDYAHYPGLFGERRVVCGQTAALVAQSALVMGGRSTALGLAAMFRLPLLMVTMKAQFEHWDQRPVFESFEREFGTEIQFIDDPESVDLGKRELALAAYDRYRAKYIKSPDSPDKLFWDIVLDRLRADQVLA